MRFYLYISLHHCHFTFYRWEAAKAQFWTASVGMMGAVAALLLDSGLIDVIEFSSEIITKVEVQSSAVVQVFLFGQNPPAIVEAYGTDWKIDLKTNADTGV